MTDVLAMIATGFSGVTLVVVVSVAFKWGRWSGVVDTRLDNIERVIRLRSNEQPARS